MINANENLKSAQKIFNINSPSSLQFFTNNLLPKLGYNSIQQMQSSRSMRKLSDWVEVQDKNADGLSIRPKPIVNRLLPPQTGQTEMPCGRKRAVSSAMPTIISFKPVKAHRDSDETQQKKINKLHELTKQTTIPTLKKEQTNEEKHEQAQKKEELRFNLF